MSGKKKKKAERSSIRVRRRGGETLAAMVGELQHPERGLRCLYTIYGPGGETATSSPRDQRNFLIDIPSSAGMASNFTTAAAAAAAGGARGAHDISARYKSPIIFSRSPG